MTAAHLTEELAAQVVERTMAVLGRNVNVMDAQGVILASGQDERAGSVHEGALLAAQQDRVVEIAAQEAGALRGVQPGVNLPLHSQGRVIGSVGITGDPEEVRILGDLIRVTAELMVEQARAVESQQWRSRERDEFVAQAAVGGVGDRDTAEWAASLDIDIDVLRVATVVVPADDRDGVEVIRSLQRELAQLRGVLVGRIAPRELVVFSPDRRRGGLSESLRERLEAYAPRIRYAVGRPFGGRTSFERAYLTARDTLAVDELLGEPTGRRSFDDVALLALVGALAEDWRGELLAEPWRRLVAADTTGELAATFRSYVGHQASVSATAADLHVHRNTVRYRLGRISEITGLRMERLSDLLWLSLAPVMVRPSRPE